MRACAFSFFWLVGYRHMKSMVQHPQVFNNLFTAAWLLTTGGLRAYPDLYFPTMITTKELWENALVELELTISKPNFNTWFRDTHIVRVDDGSVYLGVPSQFARDWLSTKFHKDILRSLRTLSESVRTVEYVISRGPKRQSDEARVVPPPMGELPLEAVHQKSNLNPRFTFGTFVVGPFNELANAAAQAVVRKPGIAYNPLLVYGP